MSTREQNENQFLKQQNEQLKSQLNATMVLTELTKVMLWTPSLEAVFRTMMLGIRETMNFERVILFRVIPEEYCLKPIQWMNVADPEVRDMRIPLSFLEGGELADTIFLNRSIIVDPVSLSDDPMRALKPKAYLALPVISKTYNRCREYHKCAHKDCPAYDSPSPYCWTIPGSGARNSEKTEDDRRRECVKCAFFKSNHVLWMDKPNSDTLVTSEDMTILNTLTNQAGIIIDNFETYENLEHAHTELKQVNIEINKINRDLKIAQAKINRDLEQAQQIQLGLLPQTLPATPFFSCSAEYIPATKVGGDYYDIFEIGEGCYCVLVADVSGHGISAALIMSMAKILIKSYADPTSTKKTIEKVNWVLTRDIKNENFITMFYALVNFRENKMTYSSAGHNPVILIDRETREVRTIKAEGIFVGVFDDAMVKDNVLPLKKNLRLVLYTDGLTEAENRTGEMYSLERLTALSEKTVRLPADEVKAEIIRDLKNHIGASPVEDDVTLLILDFN